MTPDPDVRERAWEFARYQVSRSDLLDWLAMRPGPMEDPVEADLWALIFEVDDKDITEDEARQWMADKLSVEEAVAA